MAGRDVFDIDSKAVEGQLRITVAPGEPSSPALYVLDPFFLFDLAVGVARWLRNAALITGGPFPTITVIGVGYPSEDPGELFALRARDLTPTRGEATTLVALPRLEYGGAAAFLTAVADEVVPAVEARLETNAARRALAGISWGGLFALYALFHRPELFSGYVIGSPSLWWDDGIVETWEEAWARDHRDVHARVFLSVGENEQTVGDTWKNEGFPLGTLQRVAEVDRVRALADRLGARADLAVELAVFSGEYHLTSPPAMFSRGLLSLFEES